MPASRKCSTGARSTQGPGGRVGVAGGEHIFFLEVPSSRKGDLGPSSVGFTAGRQPAFLDAWEGQLDHGPQHAPRRRGWPAVSGEG